MKKSFWNYLKAPIIGLSPMDGVTDAPWRFIAKKYGQPDVVYTEFVSVEGLWRIKKRGEMNHKIWKELAFDETERPVVAQLFGSDPDSFYEATKIVCSMGFDGIDINMGCPSPGLEKAGGGAGLIRDQGRAAAVIEATRRGVEDWKNESGINLYRLSRLHQVRHETDYGTLSTEPIRSGMTTGAEKENQSKRELPVTLKTRIGSAAPDESWWKFLATQEMPVIAMHGRTFKQLYSGEADWELIMKAGEIIRESGTIYLANGDVSKIKVNTRSNEENLYRFPIRSGMTELVENEKLVVGLTSGKEIDVTGKVDGVLIGRAAMGNPWIFRKDGYEPSIEEKLRVAVEHAKKYEEVLMDTSYSEDDTIKNNFFPMRKHLAWYAHGFPLAGELRRKLVTTNSSEDVKNEVEEFLGNK